MKNSDFAQDFQLEILKYVIYLTIAVIVTALSVHIVEHELSLSLFLFDFTTIVIALFTLKIVKRSPRLLPWGILTIFTILILLGFVIKIESINKFIVIWYPLAIMSCALLAGGKISTLIMGLALVLSAIAYKDASISEQISIYLSLPVAVFLGTIIHNKLLSFAKENEKLKNHFYELSIHDSLTGIFNRRYFMDEGVKILDLAKRKNRPITLMLFDLDDFKKINDIYGHNRGDRVLREFAYKLNDSFREYDILARIGGDEFVILIYDESPEDIYKMAQKVIQTAQSVNISADNRLGVSIGIVTLIPKRNDTLEKVIFYADKAMYEAKQKGKNRIVFYEKSH